jgi:hypothetical protein
VRPAALVRLEDQVQEEKVAHLVDRENKDVLDQLDLLVNGVNLELEDRMDNQEDQDLLDQQEQLV